jgi:BTB/POZ domain-containing protein KCTD9
MPQELLRRDLEGTWRYLERQGERMPRDPQGRPFLPPRMPSYDDEEPLGFSYFRCGLQDADNRNLTLPRTCFGRSLLERVDFRNTDLSESRMCWNDFIGCDFSGADLPRCDLRASLFRDCKFVGTILSHADLRRSAFQGCDFTGAVLTGAVADYHRDEYDLAELLTKEQQAVMDWREDPGPEPGGG